MGQNFIGCDREQELLLPPSLRDWLAEDHLAWFVLDAVSGLDLEAFYGAYRRDGWGAAARDPAMMVALLVYAYSVGERSSRAIERRCREDVAFRVISANQVPDHATIARFRVRHEAALGDLFGQVLGLCADAGLVSVGVVAVDGSKVAADASDGAVRSYDQIATEILEEAGRIDAAEDDIHGPARGDELPEHLASREGRRAWLREAKERLDAQRVEAAEPVVRDRAARLEVCRARLVEEWQVERFANREYEAHYERGVLERGRKQMGSGPRPHTPPEHPEGKVNTTDPDARRMKSGREFIPAYNAQAVTTEHQIVIAAEITTDGSDFQQLDPMITRAEAELQAAGIEDRPGVVVADAGYWSNNHIDSLRERGIVPLVAPDTNRHKPRSTRRGGPTTSCAECSPPKPVVASTHKDSGWSNPSSPKSRRTGGSTASNEEARRPHARNGAELRRSTRVPDRERSQKEGGRYRAPSSVACACWLGVAELALGGCRTPARFLCLRS